MHKSACTFFQNFSGGWHSRIPFWCCDPKPVPSPTKSWLRAWNDVKLRLSNIAFNSFAETSFFSSHTLLHPKSRSIRSTPAHRLLAPPPPDFTLAVPLICPPTVHPPIRPSDRSSVRRSDQQWRNYNVQRPSVDETKRNFYLTLEISSL